MARTACGTPKHTEKQIHSSNNSKVGNTFAKFANLGGIHSRYDNGKYEIDHYNKNMYAPNPYSRRSSTGRLSHSILYSGNSTLHSTVATSSTKPTKSGNSTAKNSTGSSQLTTSAYFSSSSESRHPKSSISFPLKAKSPKFSQITPQVINQYPSLPNIPPSSAPIVMMPQPSHNIVQYSLLPRPKPRSEIYYPVAFPAAPQPLYHQMHMFHQQYPHHGGYYTLPQGRVEPLPAYQSLPHHSQFVQSMGPQYSRSQHHTNYYSQYYNDSMPIYGYIAVSCLFYCIRVALIEFIRFSSFILMK